MLPHPAHSLIEQSLRALEGTVATNGDGFGLGWYGEHPEPGLYREVRPAWSDDNLRYLCRHIQSHLFFAHVRAATGTPTTRPNCHPFASGRFMFQHNGVIGSWPRNRRPIEALIPDQLYPSRIGTTDSEAVFLAIMGAGADTDPIGATVANARPPDRHRQYGRPPAPALHGCARRRREPVCVPLCGQRQVQHALLPRLRFQHRARLRTARPRPRHLAAGARQPRGHLPPRPRGRTGPVHARTGGGGGVGLSLPFSIGSSLSLPHTRPAPSPLAGEGWGGG